MNHCNAQIQISDRQLKGEKANAIELDLHWDSWDRNSRTSPRPPRTRAGRSSVPSEELLKSTPTPTSIQAPLSPPANSIAHMASMSRSATTSPHHPSLWSSPVTTAHHSHSSSNITPMENLHTPNVPCERRCTPPPTPPIKKGDKVRFPTTPPPRKKLNTGLINLAPDLFPLNRSKSHEEHLGHKIEATDVILQKYASRVEVLVRLLIINVSC